MSAPHRTRWGKYTLTLVDGGDRTPVDAGLSDPKLARLLDGCTGRVQVRWRFDGVGRSRTVDIAGGIDELLELCATLRTARTEDWDCDGNRLVPPGASVLAFRRPATPAGPTPNDRSEVTGGDAGGTNAAGAAGDNVAVLRAAPGPGSDTAGGEDRDEGGAADGGLLALGVRRFGHLEATEEPLQTVADVFGFFASEQARTNANHKTSKRLPRTMGGIQDALAFADDYLRERSTDGHPGTSRSVHGERAVTENDCIDLLEARRVTHLHTRAANERALRRWSDTVARAAPGDVTLPAPAPEEEVSTASTVRAMAVQVRAAFELAVVEGRIERSPWTARVERRVGAPSRTHFSERSLPSLAAVDATIDALARLERTVVVDGRRVDATGERYRMFGRLLLEVHCRPEEAIALRRSDLARLSGDVPVIVFREAMVEVTLALSPTGGALVAVPLKTCSVGDERPVVVSREFADEMLDHCERFVPEADPRAADRDRRDPLVFTTHGGGAVRLGHFRHHWWVPATEAASTDHAEVAGLHLRMLRHVGISRRIMNGDPIEQIAADAGNSPPVIHRHYRGIIAVAAKAPARTTGPQPEAVDLDAALRALTGADIDELMDRAEGPSAQERDQLRRRSGAIKGVLS